MTTDLHECSWVQNNTPHTCLNCVRVCVCVFPWPMLSLLPSLIVAHGDWVFHLRSQVQFCLFLSLHVFSVTFSLALRLIFLIIINPGFFPFYLLDFFPTWVLSVVSFHLFLVPVHSCGLSCFLVFNGPAVLLIVLHPPPPISPHRWPSQHITSPSVDVL